MRVSCILGADEIPEEPRPDLIVFPEGIEWREIERAYRLCPDAMIAAAIVEDGMGRGVLWHDGENRIDYLKVETDGLTAGRGNINQNPVYDAGPCCIGLLICMDTGHGRFSHAVTTRVKASIAPLKLLCVPAAMGNYWFEGSTISSPRFHGMNVILCNHTKNHQERCRSFVTDTNGRKIAVQDRNEPLHVELPGTSD